MLVRRVFVLSDLHLGPGGPLTTFHEGARLAKLLDGWRQHEGAIELVLAGDVFDFLQAEGYDGFSAALAAARFETIAKNRDTAAVLTALATLAARPGVELTVLAGNHDPELLVDDVREAFEEKVHRRGTVRWADDECLVAHRGDDPPVWGRALSPVGTEEPARSVWVTHGDRWDPSNYIDRDAVRAACRTGAPVVLPVGSHLVFEVLSKLKPDRRWVDELKPELSVVLPLLLAVAPRETMGYLHRHRGVAARLLVAQVRARASAGPLFGVGNSAPAPTAAGAPAAPETLLASALAAQLRTEPGDPVRLLAALEVHLERGAPPSATSDLMAAPGGAVGFLLRTWLRLHRATDRSRRIDDDDAIAPAARRFLPEGLGALIAGHTHGQRIRADLDPPYFNSGTWAPVQVVPDGNLRAWLDGVVAADAPRTPSPGTYVRIDLGDGPPVVAVEEAPL